MQFPEDSMQQFVAYKMGNWEQSSAALRRYLQQVKMQATKLKERQEREQKQQEINVAMKTTERVNSRVELLQRRRIELQGECNKYLQLLQLSNSQLQLLKQQNQVVELQMQQRQSETRIKLEMMEQIKKGRKTIQSLSEQQNKLNEQIEATLQQLESRKTKLILFQEKVRRSEEMKRSIKQFQQQVEMMRSKLNEGRKRCQQDKKEKESKEQKHRREKEIKIQREKKEMEYNEEVQRRKKQRNKILQRNMVEINRNVNLFQNVREAYCLPLKRGQLEQWIQGVVTAYILFKNQSKQNEGGESQINSGEGDSSMSLQPYLRLPLLDEELKEMEANLSQEQLQWENERLKLKEALQLRDQLKQRVVDMKAQIASMRRGN